MARNLSRYERMRCYRLGLVFERSGWLVMAVVVCGAVAGIFGDGVFSRVEVAAGDALAARYPRFARSHAPLEIDIEWTAHEPDAAIWIGRAYLDQFEVEEVRPPPAGVTLGPERIYYTFRLREPSDRARISLRLRPEHAGRVRGSLGADAQAEVELSHLIFP